jgi:hypothetical protein
MSFTLSFSFLRPYVYIFVCLKKQKRNKSSGLLRHICYWEKTKMAKRERKEEKKNFIRHLFPFFFINEKKRNISFQSCFWRCRLTLSLSHASKAKQSNHMQIDL